MSKPFKPAEISVYKAWIEAIVSESSDKLNDWENTFIDSLSLRLNSGNNLSEGQANKLEEMYSKFTK